MYDLTCINGMTDFDSVTQWLVPFANLAWRRSAAPRPTATSLREIVIVDQNFRAQW
jgi:hypothetical protein